MRALKILIFLFIGLLIGLETGGKAYAGASVSVEGTPTTTWAIGAVQGGEVATSGAAGRSADKWTVTGCSDGISEDIYIKVTGINWDPAAAAGTDAFVLKHDVSGSWGSAITNSGNGILLIEGLAVAGTQDFDLEFTAPTGGTEGAETLTVTLTATNWVPPPIFRVFVTSTFYTGNLGGLTGADAKCQARADAASLGGSWTAWLSDGSASAANRVAHHDWAYMLVDETTKVADNWADLTDGSIDHKIDMNELGGSVPGGYVWTDSKADGSLWMSGSDGHCSGWTTTDDLTQGFYGYTGDANQYWTEKGAQTCDYTQMRLYCFED